MLQHNPIKQVSSQKHRGMILDIKRNFQELIKNILRKVNKTIGLLRKLQNIMPQASLFTTFKLFVRPYLDQGDIIIIQSNNNTIHQKMESVQYNAALAITGTIRGSSSKNFIKNQVWNRWWYKKQRRWYRKLSYLSKLTKNQSPKYLFDNISTVRRSTYRTRNIDSITQLIVRRFQKFILPIHCN